MNRVNDCLISVQFGLQLSACLAWQSLWRFLKNQRVDLVFFKQTQLVLFLPLVNCPQKLFPVVLQGKQILILVSHRVSFLIESERPIMPFLKFFDGCIFLVNLVFSVVLLVRSGQLQRRQRVPGCGIDTVRFIHLLRELFEAFLPRHLGNANRFNLVGMLFLESSQTSVIERGGHVVNVLVVAMRQADNNDLFVGSGACLYRIFGCGCVVYVLIQGGCEVVEVGSGHDCFIFPHIKDVKQTQAEADNGFGKAQSG